MSDVTIWSVFQNPVTYTYICTLMTKLFLFYFPVFIPFQSCYHLLYQCLVPNTSEALSLLVQHYNVPDDFERIILSGENLRVCNQGILNYLLIVLRRDKDFVKFWNTVKLMTNHLELKTTVEQIQKGIVCMNACGYIII